jgi:hypothetical protein
LRIIKESFVIAAGEKYSAAAKQLESGGKSFDQPIGKRSSNYAVLFQMRIL